MGKKTARHKLCQHAEESRQLGAKLRPDPCDPSNNTEAVRTDIRLPAVQSELESGQKLFHAFKNMIYSEIVVAKEVLRPHQVHQDSDLAMKFSVLDVGTKNRIK